ncbi:hypothetical protein Tco_0363168 [Tanacetum coccineum]
MQIVNTTNESKDGDVQEKTEYENVEEEPARATRDVPISTVRPQMRLNPEDGIKIELIRSLRPQPTVATPTEVQPTSSIISITQPKSPPMAPIADREKAIVTDDTKEPARKLVPEMTKSELIKVVHEEASNVGIDLKVLKRARGGQEFKKIQDAKIKVHKREHSQKAKKAMGLRKKRLDQYILTTSNRIKPEPITNFADFGVIELDELDPIIQSKKNKIVSDLMTSLGKRYERLKKIPKELVIQSALLAPTSEQGSSQLSGKKRKNMELELEIRILALECNMSLP